MLDEARQALGRNNVSARAEVDGRSVFVKRYFRHIDDPRDRLGTEFAVLTFLRENGLRCIPEPIARDDAEGIGVYEYIEATPLRSGDVSREDGLQLADLLVRMHRLRDAPKAAVLPAASDAAFSFRTYLERLQARLDRVRKADPFVEEQAAPAAADLRAWLESRAPELDVDVDTQTPFRTLSPGDIGFHNALRRTDGSLAFVDFEYGGWDDAAHVIASACVPPGVPLPDEDHLPVLRALLAGFDGGPELAARVRLVYPLLALKWSLILLNELVGVDRERRRYAGALDEAADATQVIRARRELERALAAAEPTSFLEELVA